MVPLCTAIHSTTPKLSIVEVVVSYLSLLRVLCVIYTSACNYAFVK
jgi:hypothetical protein